MGKHERDTGDWWQRNWSWFAIGGCIVVTQIAQAHGIYPSWSPNYKP